MNCLSMTAVCCVGIVSLYNQKDEVKCWSCCMMVNDILKIHGWRHWPVLTFGGQESTRRMKTRSKRATVAKRRDTTLHQLHYTRGSFQTSHGRADYAGLFEEKILLIVTDAYLKWLEVKPVTAANSIVTIDHLRNMLATHSLPKTLVTDNRTQFTRLQRWLLLLAAYDYDIEFRSTRAQTPCHICHCLSPKH